MTTYNKQLTKIHKERDMNIFGLHGQDMSEINSGGVGVELKYGEGHGERP